MSIIAFSVENYRAFGERTEIELRPLTLFFGYNSAGKSALLRLLPLVSDSIQIPGEQPLALLSPPARGASFSDIRSKHSAKPSIAFSLTWRDGEIRTANFVLRDLPEFGSQVVERLQLRGREGELLLEAELVPQTDRPGELPKRYLLRGGVVDPSVLEVHLRFRGLVPEVLDEEISISIIHRFHLLAGILDRFSQSVHWLQALRRPPLRLETFLGRPHRIKEDGSGITQLLAYDETSGGKVLDEISRWYELATGHRLVLTRGTFAGKALFSFVLTSTQGPPVDVEVIDTGEGMGQVLPVISLLSLAKAGRLGPNPIIAIEHPELHLHPAAHPALAAAFCSVASSDTMLTTLVETHSENFLLGVQLAIVEQVLNPRNVLVYWVRQSDSGAGAVEKIEFDNLGRPLGDKWPPGVFSENAEQSRRILLARRARVDK